MDSNRDGLVGFSEAGPMLLKKGMFEGYPDEYVGYCPEWVWFCDFAGVNATHSPYQYNLISQVMKHHPPEVIVELGTAHGALSLYLGVCGAVVGAQVHTFDYDREQSKPVWGAFERMGIQFHNMDFLEHKDFVAALLRGRKSYVICDGEREQKALELETFAPHITPGSCISVHDYYSEVHPEDIEETIGVNGLVPFQRSEWMRHAVMFATWIKE
jgi:cephalosporin hydroxylase